MRSSTVQSGLSTKCTMPSTTSLKLWGGMLVAIPTAMPAAPLTSKFGILEGNTVGSFKLSSKLGRKSTVSLSKSANISSAALRRRASV